jgi:hypothetical protein
MKITAQTEAVSSPPEEKWHYICDAHAQHTKTTRDWTAYKHAAAHGDALGSIPTTPALGVPPPTVPPDIFGLNCDIG